MSTAGSPNEVRRVGHGWAAVHQTVARSMLDYLNKSEELKVNAREFENRVLAPNEPNINIYHIVMQARDEGHQRLSRCAVGKEQMRHWSPVWRGGRNIKGCSSYWNRRAKNFASRRTIPARGG